MEPKLGMEEDAQNVLKTLFRMCRDTRMHQQNVSELARQIPLDFAVTKRIVADLERKDYVMTLSFGQKVTFTDAGLVVTQRLIH
jgi:hypothetical protein